MDIVVDISEIADAIDKDLGYKIETSSILLKNDKSQIIKLSNELCIKICIGNKSLLFPEILKRNEYLCVPLRAYTSPSQKCIGYTQRFLNLYNIQNLIKNKITLPEKKAGQLIYYILKGLDTLHRNGYLHCDLHPENIMLHSKANKLIAVIVDFDEMKLAGPDTRACYRYSGYNAPEIVLYDSIYDDKAEIFPVGVVLWELLFGECQFAGYSFFGKYINESWEEYKKNKEQIEQKTCVAIKNIANYMYYLKRLSSECAESLWSLINPNKLERFTAHDALALSFFKQFDKQ